VDLGLHGVFGGDDVELGLDDFQFALVKFGGGAEIDGGSDEKVAGVDIFQPGDVG